MDKEVAVVEILIAEATEVKILKTFTNFHGSIEECLERLELNAGKIELPELIISIRTQRHNISIASFLFHGYILGPQECS